MKRRALVAFMATTMMASMLTGCSFNVSFSGFGTPKDAESVVERYMDKQQEANYNMTGNISMEFGLDADGMSMSIPMVIGLDLDILDKAAHGTMDMKASFMGESMNESTELYVADGKTYTESDNGWTVQDSGAMSSIGASLDAELFKDAELTVDKKAKTYTVAQDLGTFMSSDEMRDNVSEMTDDIADMFDMDSDDILDELSDASVVYVFNSDYQLLSVTLDEVSYEKEMQDDDFSGTVYVKFDFDFEFSQFGEITNADVKLPKSVKSGAVEESDSDIISDFETDIDTDMSEGIDIETEISGDDVVVTMPTEELDSGFSVAPVGTDIFGYYNGTALDTDANDWASTFGADGWTFANEDGEYSFMSCENAKYPGADLYVYNYKRENTTKSDITNTGFYSYDINVSLADKKPDMSFNGLTWGASGEDIIRAYGEPTYTYTGSMFTSYEFDINDNVEMTFYVYEDGLQSVHLDVYNW